MNAQELHRRALMHAVAAEHCVNGAHELAANGHPGVQFAPDLALAQAHAATSAAFTALLAWDTREAGR